LSTSKGPSDEQQKKEKKKQGEAHKWLQQRFYRTTEPATSDTPPKKKRKKIYLLAGKRLFQHANERDRTTAWEGDGEQETTAAATTKQTGEKETCMNE